LDFVTFKDENFQNHNKIAQKLNELSTVKFEALKQIVAYIPAKK
jgi:hypothetical protein